MDDDSEQNICLICLHRKRCGTGDTIVYYCSQFIGEPEDLPKEQLTLFAR